MTSLTALWLPIFLSAVACFLVSSLIHMFTPWHRAEYPAVPNEEAFRAATRGLDVPPGDYMIPRTSAAHMNSPEFLAKMNEGPVWILTALRPGPWGMGRNLARWFVYLLVISACAGYVASRALSVGAPYLTVFRFVGVSAFLGYSAALWQMWIWYRRALRTTITSSIDGLIYACVTAGVFGWLWPR
ncbi:MAG: hypothetical protein K2X99_12725 [Gemmatimonadaceae bacterium]|nr:hypothetical protein [Gemmatimonadaceae bacterium]